MEFIGGYHRNAVKGNTRILQARAFLALATYVLEKNGVNEGSFLDLPANSDTHAEAMSRFRLALLDTENWDLDFVASSMGWATPLTNMARAIDLYLAIENAYCDNLDQTVGLIDCFPADPTCDFAWPSTSTQQQASGYIVLGPPSEGGRTGKELLHPIHLTQVADVRAIDIGLGYDVLSTAISGVQIQLTDGWQAAYNIDGDTLRIAMVGDASLPAGQIGLVATKEVSGVGLSGASTRLGGWAGINDEPRHAVGTVASKYDTRTSSTEEAATEVASASKRLDHERPEHYALEAAYPNPFNPRTTIRFALPEETDVELVVYDALGREVARLVDGPVQAGYHEAVFEAKRLPSGVYLYELRAGRFTETGRMVLAK